MPLLSKIECIAYQNENDQLKNISNKLLLCIMLNVYFISSFTESL